MQLFIERPSAPASFAGDRGAHETRVAGTVPRIQKLTLVLEMGHEGCAVAPEAG